jgi:hypothetical protein
MTLLMPTPNLPAVSVAMAAGATATAASAIAGINSFCFMLIV